MRVAAVQLHIGTSRDENVDHVLRLIDEAAAQGAELVMLPEWITFTGSVARYPEIAETIPGPTSDLIADKAREHALVIHGGSVIERLPNGPAPGFSNTSFVVDGAGVIRAVYRKVHLFDVEVGDEVCERESASTVPGDRLVAVELPELTLGMSICYDLRFPEVYRALALAGATVMAVPSAFAEATGRAHWEVLLRARAIENGAYVVAPAQHGRGAAFPMFGHTMIVDPWGSVIAVRPQGDGVVLADIDPAEALRRRAQIPVLANRRPQIYKAPVHTSCLAFSPGM